jgi:hypothetical protein
MQKLVLVLAVAAIGTFAVGTALAHNTLAIGSIQGSPHNQGDIYYPTPIVGPFLGGHDDIHDITIWEESNDCYGLQENAADIAADHCKAGTTPDTQIV